ncbi:MAG: pentapeptide repeat-containing protein [Micromonosporaceae bacterium]
MRPVHIIGGDWAYVSLRGADLRGANLEGVPLRGLDLTEVRIDLTQAALFAAAHGARVEP